MKGSKVYENVREEMVKTFGSVIDEQDKDGYHAFTKCCYLPIPETSDHAKWLIRHIDGYNHIVDGLIANGWEPVPFEGLENWDGDIYLGMFFTKAYTEDLCRLTWTGDSLIAAFAKKEAFE